MKKYELSLTKRYVSSWGIKEAIRELIQNAYDEDNGEAFFGENFIRVQNKNTSIPSSTLALGTSTKRDDNNKVGCYGEGFKLAILVLLREGYSVDIENGNKKWIPYFGYSDTFETEVLCIDEEDNDGTDLVFEISNVPEYIINELKDEFLGINGISYNSIPTMYGEIITDKEFKGKMFVNGLPIMKDNKFEFGYNFKPEYVSLDRDRKSINLRELYEITSLAIAYMENPDFNMVDNIIDGTSDDAYYLKERNINLPDDFVNEYSKHLRERFGVDDQTVIVNKESKEIISELKRKQQNDNSIKIVETPKSIYAHILNRNNTYSSNILNDVHNELSHKSEIEEAWDDYEYSDYKKLHEWFQEYGTEVGKDEFYDILSNIEPSGFDLIREEV